MKCRWTVMVLMIAGCARGVSEGFDDQTSNDTTPAFNGSDGGLPCVNLECQQAKCDGHAKTTLVGTVSDPAGKNPIYNAIVYVPNAPLAPLKSGATCDRCGSVLSGSPITTAL